LVASPLVERSIQAGRRLVDSLEMSGFRVVAAFWLLEPETLEWKLLICSPLVDVAGPRLAYQKIQQTLKGLRGLALDLREIRAVGTDDQTVRLMQKATGASPGIADVRFRNSVIDGTLIDDAYIYRVA